ncbi:hypothetical protein VYU27_002617 [Nannochloropsis oceanica]
MTTTRLVRPPRLLGFGGRPYNFFERDALPQNLSSVLKGKFAAVLMVEGALIFGDDQGHITFTDADLRLSLQHRILSPPPSLPSSSYPSLLLARSRQSPPLIVAAGLHGPDAKIMLHTWIGSKVSSPSNSIALLPLLGGLSLGGDGDNLVTIAATPTALACNHNGTKLVIGFKSGLVVLLEGDFAKDRARFQPPTILLRPPSLPSSSSSSVEGACRAVTGLIFMQMPEEGGRDSTVMVSGTGKAAAFGGAGGERRGKQVDPDRLYVILEDVLESSSSSTSTTGSKSLASASLSPRTPIKITAVGENTLPSSSSPAFPSSGGVFLFSTTSTPSTTPSLSPHLLLTLDDAGASLGCASLDLSTQDLLIGRRDALYFYSEEEGRKGALGFHVHQRLCTLSSLPPSSSSPSTTTSSSILVASTDEVSGRTTVHVYDLLNKIVAFQTTLPADQKIISLLSEGALAYVVTSQGQVWRLREKSIGAKLKLLVQDMKLFPVAIKLAYSSNYPVAQIMEIYRRYADYLYEKKRAFDESVQQYIHTIGYLDPSYVIARFLDPQRSDNLTAYLEALHRQGQATADLTTLLLHCYTKMKDTGKLDKLVFPERYLEGGEEEERGEEEEEEMEEEEAEEGEGKEGGKKGEKVPFFPAGLALLPPEEGKEWEEEDEGGEGGMEAASVNTALSRERQQRQMRMRRGGVDVEAAVTVLRAAGYPEHALEVARKYRAHDWYLRIQLEKPSPSYRDALAYISSLPFLPARHFLSLHGHRLLHAYPEETTGVLMALCTGHFPPSPPSLPPSLDPKQRAPAEDFLHLFVDHPKWLRLFLECVMREPPAPPSLPPSLPSLSGGASSVFASPTLASSSLPSSSSVVANALLDLLIQDWKEAAAAAAAAAASAAAAPVPTPASSALSNGTNIINNKSVPTPFSPSSRLSETNGMKSSSAPTMKEQVKHTVASLKAAESALLSFLETYHGRYDEDQALVLVQMHNFKPGQLLLFDKRRQVEMVLEHYMEAGEVGLVLQRMGRKENKKNAALWGKVLAWVVGRAGKKERKEGSEEKESDDEEVEDDEDEDEEVSEDEEAVWDDVMRVLQMVEREHVLPPHLVIDMLSQHANLPLFVVRPFLTRLLKEAYSDVHTSQQKINSLRKSTTEKRAEVKDLRSTARLFQTTTCTSCRRPLELPAVHFLCMHSYHLEQSCLAQEGKCNECAADHHHYERIQLKDQRGKAMEHELFFSELEDQGFAAVASYFGKGVLNV